MKERHRIYATTGDGAAETEERNLKRAWLTLEAISRMVGEKGASLRREADGRLHVERNLTVTLSRYEMQSTFDYLGRMEVLASLAHVRSAA
jgi:hypothetical protein